MSKLPGRSRQGPTRWTGGERLVHGRQGEGSLGPFLLLIFSLITLYLLKGLCWAQVFGVLGSPLPQRWGRGHMRGSRDREQMNKKMMTVYEV